MSGDTDAVQYGLAISSVLIAVTGIFSNSLSLSYFITQTRSAAAPQVRKNSNTRLFMVLNVFDFLLCIYSTLMIVIWVEVLDMGFPTTFKCFCVFYQAVLANLTSFITCLIAVIRAVDLVRLPNVMKGRRMTTNLAIFVYSLITVCLAIFEMFHISKKDITENVTSIALAVIGANMTAMFAIIIVSNIVCMLKLYLTQSQGIVSETRHATVTVGILSLIYCLCNAGFIYDRVTYATTLILPGHIHSIVFHSILLPLNSACNPVVYFMRKADMRLHLTNVVTNARRCCNRSPGRIEPSTECTAISD